MNPYLIIGLIVGWGASLVGAFWFGTSYEGGQEAKQQVLIDKATTAVKAANQQFSDDLGTQIATELSSLRIVNRTINNEIHHEVETRLVDNPDCNVPTSIVRLLNASRGYGADPSPGGPSGGVRPGGEAAGAVDGR